MIDQLLRDTVERSNANTRDDVQLRHEHALFGARAFSLVEVALALGIVAFCVIALIGALPLGLQAEQGSYNQMQGLRLLNEIQKDLASVAKPFSDPNNPGNAEEGQTFTTTQRFQIPLSLPQTPVPATSPVSGNFTVDESFYLSTGTTSAEYPPRYAVHYDYTHYVASSMTIPPYYVPYQIRVMVAWPATAQFANSGANLTVTGANGYVETIMTINRF